MVNEIETFKLLKWPSKVIIANNWFSGGVQANIIVEEHIAECKGI